MSDHPILEALFAVYAVDYLLDKRFGPRQPTTKPATPKPPHTRLQWRRMCMVALANHSLLLITLLFAIEVSYWLVSH